jgi:hypothetical protein
LRERKLQRLDLPESGARLGPGTIPSREVAQGADNLDLITIRLAGRRAGDGNADRPYEGAPPTSVAATAEWFPGGFRVGQEQPQAVHAQGQAVFFPAGDVALTDGRLFGRLATAEAGLDRGLR